MIYAQASAPLAVMEPLFTVGLGLGASGGSSHPHQFVLLFDFSAASRSGYEWLLWDDFFM